MTLTTTLIFSGFYSSLHSDAIDNSIEQMFTDMDTGCHSNEGLESRVMDKCDYHEVFKAYAKRYSVNFAEHFSIPSMKFVELSSPREYNFTSDIIYADISLQDAQRIYEATLPANLVKTAMANHTSRDGFSSFYDPDVDTWGELEDWDHNQLGTLLEAYADQENGEPFDQWAEYSLMGDDFGNGYPDSWIAENTPGIERLFKINHYLNMRAAR